MVNQPEENISGPSLILISQLVAEEGEAIMGRGQIPIQKGLDKAKKRFPFGWKEIHSDNGTEYINAHLFRYTEKENLLFSRSRPNKKNDNCFVEQKNWTHLKKFVGYLRI